MKRLSQSEMRSLLEQMRAKFSGLEPRATLFTEPFRHCVIDAFLPDWLAHQCLDSFPNSAENHWVRANDEDIEIKARSNWSSEFDIPDGIVDAIRLLNSAPFLLALGNALQIPKLVPDPYFSGGGLNVTQRGGLLDVHVDGNYHDATGLNRRVNVILYLNPGWEESWGGALGLYDQTGETCVKKIAPIFNRLFAFDTHDFSFHGLPEAINFPLDVERKSVILYYYTASPRESNTVSVAEPHSALWKKRGLLDKRGNKTRQYS